MAIRPVSATQFTNPQFKKEFAAQPIDKPAEPRMDLVELSAELKKHPPTPGLVNTLVKPEDCAAVRTDEKLRIDFFDITDFKHSSCEVNALRGNVDDYFFHLDTNFIEKQATAILNGGEFDQYGQGVQSFMSGVTKWFSEKDCGSFMNSLKDLVYEYSERLQNGGDTNLRSLKTTFTIQGESVTLGSILDMRDAAKVLSGDSFDNLGGKAGGTDMHYMFAQKGIMKAAASHYAKTLPPALGAEFEKKFSALWEKNVQACKDLWSEHIPNVAKQYQDYTKWVGKVSNASYDLFSGLDFSSRPAAQADLQSILNQYERLLTSGKYSQRAKMSMAHFQSRITEVFQAACSAIF